MSYEYVEKAFLGSLMKESFLINDTVIRPGQLESTRHQQLFRDMIELNKAGKGVDLISLTTLPNLVSFGGISYLNELLSFADIEKFSKIEDHMLDAWKEREKRNILKLASFHDWEITKVLEELDKINKIRSDDYTSISDALVDLYEAPWQDADDRKGVPTGIHELDELIGGFQEGEVTILAARPSMGKTDCMLHFAKHAGWSGYLPIIFSLEMPEKMLTTRLIASVGGFNRSKMRDPKNHLSPKQKEKWPHVMTELSKTHIQIFDHGGQTVPEIRAKTRKIMNQFPNKKPIVFIDYLTLIRPNQTNAGNTHMQVTEISQNLKTLAKDFQCPVICLAQLNRGVESRANKRPLMSDIRESGSVEQDADVIVFLYREKYYETDSENNRLELIISKNRNGQVGMVDVHYNEFTGGISGEH